MSETSRLLEWRGHAVVDRTGQPLGSVDAIYLDLITDRPKWVLLDAGPGGLIPLANAVNEGDRIRVAFDAALIASAPSPSVDEELSPADEETLLAHYELAPADAAIDLGPPSAAEPPREPAPPGSGASRLRRVAPESARDGDETDAEVATVPGVDPAGPRAAGVPGAVEAPPARQASERRGRRRRPVASVTRAARRNPVGVALGAVGVGFLAGLLRDAARSGRGAESPSAASRGRAASGADHRDDRTAPAVESRPARAARDAAPARYSGRDALPGADPPATGV